VKNQIQTQFPNFLELKPKVISNGTNLLELGPEVEVLLKS
jgi:hypothetical protein